MRFEQREDQLAEVLGLKGFEEENRSELLLSVKITVQEKYFKVRHVTDFCRGRHHALKGQREVRASTSIIFLETRL